MEACHAFVNCRIVHGIRSRSHAVNHVQNAIVNYHGRRLVHFPAAHDPNVLKPASLVSADRDSFVDVDFTRALREEFFSKCINKAFRAAIAGWEHANADNFRLILRTDHQPDQVGRRFQACPTTLWQSDAKIEFLGLPNFGSSGNGQQANEQKDEI